MIDRAIQVHGGAGVSQDVPLSRMYALARTLRIADGPDEVHNMVVARREIGVVDLVGTVHAAHFLGDGCTLSFADLFAAAVPLPQAAVYGDDTDDVLTA